MKKKTAPISIVYPFYNQHRAFEFHLAHWCAYSDELKRAAEFIIVDDCSNKPLKIEKIVQLNIRVFRVTKNIIWNYGAKNLGVQMSFHDSIFLSELDHLLDAESFAKMLSLPREPPWYYMFKRHNYAAGARSIYRKSVHWATFLFEKEAFWRVGGIDEDFAGAYGYDDIFLIDCFEKIKCRRRVAPGIVLRNFSDNLELPDADLKDDPLVPRDTTRNEKILKEKRASQCLASPEKIRFPWEQTFAYALQ